VRASGGGRGGGGGGIEDDELVTLEVAWCSVSQRARGVRPRARAAPVCAHAVGVCLSVCVCV
jgi:hypothetical protein